MNVRFLLLIRQSVCAIVLLTATLYTGCIGTQVARLTPAGSGDVPVYMAGLSAPAVTAVIYIECFGGIFNTKKQLLRKIKQRAAKEPAVNALVNVRFGYAGLYPWVDGVGATAKD